MKIEFLESKKVVLNPGNPRFIIDAKFENLVQSIKDFPEMLEIRPIVINGENVILGGNMRFRAAVKAGLKKIPVIKALDLTPEQEKEFVIKDNVSGGEWDWDMLANEWEESDLMEWGLDLPTEWGVEELPDEVLDEAAFDNLQTEPVSKLGDLWILGDHKILCGDSADVTQIEKVLGDEKADLVFTDPPYLIETQGGTNGELGKFHKKLAASIESISDFNPADFLAVLPSVFDGSHNSYVFCNRYLLPDYLKWAVDSKLSFNVLVWKKPAAIPIGSGHYPDIEYLLFFRKNAIWNHGLGPDVSYSRVIEEKRESGLHPTMKPVPLIENQLLLSSNKGSVVFDFFLGSGSTLIACEKTGRICRGLEHEPSYIDVIIKRWQKYTGQNAVLESTGQSFDEVENVGSLE